MSNLKLEKCWNGRVEIVEYFWKMLVFYRSNNISLVKSDIFGSLMEQVPDWNCSGIPEKREYRTKQY